jgi:hypothetical protein
MFRTAAAAGWTPETRYKTSFYSMLGGDGQTEGWDGQMVRRRRSHPRLFDFEWKRTRATATHETYRAALGMEGLKTRPHTSKT